MTRLNTYPEIVAEITRLVTIRPMTVLEVRAAMAPKVRNALLIAEGNRQAINRFKTVTLKREADGKYRLHPAQ